MSSKRNHYYVLVFTDNGPVYVTSVSNLERYSVWDKTKAPKEFPKYYAEDIALGLNLNCYQAVVVASRYEIEYQPYNYTDFECKFVEKT